MPDYAIRYDITLFFLLMFAATLILRFSLLPFFAFADAAVIFL